MSLSSHADDQDTALRLNQRLELEANQQERQILKDEDYLKGERPTLTINGKTYTIRHEVNDVGRALYLSVQQKQWSAVVYFLNEYLMFENSDPMLVAYAQGSLARLQGFMDQAEAEFKILLEIQPDFLLGQLELARVLFENRKDSESQAMLTQVFTSLNPDDPRQQGVLTTVERFLQAVDKRQSWQGSIAAGPVWSDNLNQTSESYTCLYYYDETCVYERETPSAIQAHGLGYELSLNKRFALSGHHGMYVRSVWFGQNYKDYAHYNENQLSTQFGYSYHNMRNQYAIAPSFEFSHYGNNSLYGAWGVHGEWLHYLTDKVMFKLEADYKDQRYRKDNLADQYNGGIWSGFATAWYALPNDWMVFGGLDYSRKKAQVDQLAYQQTGIRTGLAKTFNQGINAVLFTALRERDHDEYSAIFEQKRRDIEQNYTLIVRFPKFRFYGLEPNLTLKHRKVRSNVDWLYSHNRNSISFKLEKKF
ncbi:surface lipoprotein assembly modifier [Catenovulum sp. 2E275]|uniref:surface lipoprotein assembly modifier n=1 Tax=Catenovulum sp. 2E275 TaxID=2980497 RepID=UPI0021D30AE6|nr:surface lipoprotein assembly modifier [Catenovulum sp. 2E275]MCU4675292.1 surface lipoprotein assembly modifier [Catenovulum sp. 2E275]